MQFGSPLSLIAAQQLIYNQAIASGVLTTVPLPPGTKTLVLFTNEASGASPTNVTVIGQQSGYTYYNQAPYLQTSPSGGGFGNMIVVPVNGLVDSSVTVSVSYPGPSLTVAIFADTAQYKEDVFYNGIYRRASLNSTTVLSEIILSGPARLADWAIEVVGTGGTSLLRDAYGNVIDRVDTNASNQVICTTGAWPADTILDVNSQLQADFASAIESTISVGYYLP